MDTENSPVLTIINDKMALLSLNSLALRTLTIARALRNCRWVDSCESRDGGSRLAIRAAGTGRTPGDWQGKVLRVLLGNEIGYEGTLEVIDERKPQGVEHDLQGDTLQGVPLPDDLKPTIGERDPEFAAKALEMKEKHASGEKARLTIEDGPSERVEVELRVGEDISEPDNGQQAPTTLELLEKVSELVARWGNKVTVHPDGRVVIE